MYVCVCVYIYICVYVYVYIYIYICMVSGNLGVQIRPPPPFPPHARSMDSPPQKIPKTLADALFPDFLCPLFGHHFTMPLLDVSRAFQDGPRRPRTATRRPKSRRRADFGGFLRPKSIQVGTQYASQSYLMWKSPESKKYYFRSII